MPGTWHEPAGAAHAQVTILGGWRALRPLEPALEALQRAAGTPVTARLPWWRSAVTADRGAVPVLLRRPGPGGTLRAAALIALRETDEGWQVTSGRPHSDDVWEVAATSAAARRAILAELVSFTRAAGPPVAAGADRAASRRGCQLARRAAAGWPRGHRATGPGYRLHRRRGDVRGGHPARPGPLRAPDRTARADRGDQFRARAGPAGEAARRDRGRAPGARPRHRAGQRSRRGGRRRVLALGVRPARRPGRA